MALRARDGARAFFGGAGFVLGTPRVWPWAAVPGAMFLVAFASLAALGVKGAGALANAWLPDEGGWAGLGNAALTALGVVLALVVALVASFSLAQPLSGFALDVVVRAQDAAMGAAPLPSVPRARALWHTLGATALGLLACAAALGALSVVGFLFPPALVVTLPLKFVVSALLVAWDLLDYPFGLRGLGVVARLRFIGRNFWAVLAFGSLGALVALVPGGALALLPIGAAGASHLVTADAKNPVHPATTASKVLP